jgi:outer membrane protein OmpA-like peptidoglycan-associated protein
MSLRFVCVFVACCCVIAPALWAQPSTDTVERSELQYIPGVFGGVGRIWNTTTLPIIAGSTDCGTFSDGQSTGIRAGISLDYPILPGWLEASGRLMYDQRPASLQAETQLSEVFDQSLNAYVPLRIGHTYDATLAYLVLDIGVRARPIQNFPAYLRLSVDAGNALFGATFDQQQEVASPGFILFNDGTKRHSVADGKIQDLSTSYGASAAIGGEIPFQPDLVLVPEISYRHGLNSVLKLAEWKTQAIYGTLGLQWKVYRDNSAPAPDEDAPTPRTPDGVAPLVITSLSTRPLEVQETIVTQTFPLLPYIFFDSTGAQLRERYNPRIQQTTFSEKDLPKEALATYYHLLHIVAKRMKEHPRARLTITGTTDGKELATPAQRRELAEQRAKTTADYLVKTWGIDPRRLDIRTADIPTLASSIRYAEGNEENRRAEITSDDPAILEPVVHSRFLEYLPVQDKQQFSVEVLRPERADSWDLSVFHKQTLMTVKNGDNAPKPVVDIALAPETLKALGPQIEGENGELRGNLQIVQDDGSVLHADCIFPVKKTRSEFEVSRLSLIVFDFDRSDITPHNKEMMKRFVAEALKPTSEMSITGSTDRLGEAQYNMELSQMRAETVQKYLLTLQPQARIRSVRGVGSSTLPYDNNLPEGRYYCRTVSLEVRTPLQK